MTAFTATYASGRPRTQFYRQLRWLRIDQLAELPTSIPQRSLWERLAEAV
jgi:hypothetical protein